MLRRSSIRLHRFLSTYSTNGRSAILKSPTPLIPLARCGTQKPLPTSVISPIHLKFFQCLRQYCAETGKATGEIDLKIDEEETDKLSGEIDPEADEGTDPATGEIGLTSEGDEENDKETGESDLKPDDEEVEDEDEELPRLRFEDYEPELKIFEDPFEDRKPPPEPDEETKKEVAELVEILRKFVDEMPPEKRHKNRQAGGKQGKKGGGLKAEQENDELQEQSKEQ